MPSCAPAARPEHANSASRQRAQPGPRMAGRARLARGIWRLSKQIANLSRKYNAVETQRCCHACADTVARDVCRALCCDGDAALQRSECSRRSARCSSNHALLIAIAHTCSHACHKCALQFDTSCMLSGYATLEVGCIPPASSPSRTQLLVPSISPLVLQAVIVPGSERSLSAPTHKVLQA